MLKSLYIKNYAIIDELNIEFSDRFNVFTGETGAGKSIIVGALSYLTKGKADTSIIKSGKDKAVIEGVFTIEDYMREMLDEADIDYDDELIVRRTISNDNHNTIKINQCSVTLNFLSELFSDHIDIHSQKDSHYLLNKKNHMLLLDKYLDNKKLLQQYKEEYSQYNDFLKEFNELKNNTYDESQLDYYRFDLKELEDAKLSIDEENDLINKENRYKSAEKYISALTSSIDLYLGEDGARDRIYQIIKQLNIDDDNINNTKDRIESLYYELNDEIDGLEKILNSFNEDEMNIEYIEERLYTYSKLKRKHNLTTEELIGKKEELKEKIQFFEDKDFVLSEKQKQLDVLYEKAYSTAEKIAKLRHQKAIELEKNIIKQCSDLILNNVRFHIQLDRTELNSNGIDDVEFFISLNQGEDLKPLRNVASGGEISRLMLALKRVFTSLSDTILVVFDEIDTGISGRTGLSVGIKIAEIAKNTQVIAISHLASVAACASDHFYIYKKDENNSTTTLIKKLEGEEIIDELAYISNTDNSSMALEAARELYKTAQESIK